MPVLPVAVVVVALPEEAGEPGGPRLGPAAKGAADAALSGPVVLLLWVAAAVSLLPPEG
jgi:hypothetical protein